MRPGGALRRLCLVGLLLLLAASPSGGVAGGGVAAADAPPETGLLPPAQAWSPCRVEIREPGPAQVLFGVTRLLAEATCPAGVMVREVTFLVDGLVVGRATEPPYRGRYDAAESFIGHRIEARLIDAQDRVSRAVVITSAIPFTEAVRVTATPLDLVELSVSVRGADGQALGGLTRDDFEVTEGGRKQRLETVRPEVRPLSLAVLVDVSSSVRNFWPSLREAAPALARTLGPDDAAQVVAFSGPAYLVQDFTHDPGAIAASLAGFRHWGGGTSLYDTLAAVGVELAWARGGRQAVILLTDGIDTLSRIDAPRLRGYLRRSDLIVETILLPPEGSAEPRGYGGLKKTIETLCRETGGTVRVLEDFGQLERAFREIGQGLQDRYYLAYHSDRGGRGKGWRSIEVAVKRPGARVMTRAGLTDRRDIVDGLLHDLKRGDAAARRQAAAWLGGMRASAATEALLETLEDRSVEVRSAAMVALARLRELRAIGPILGMLVGRDPGLQVAATEALLIFGPAAVPALAEALERLHEEGNEDAEVRVLETLAELGDSGALAAMSRAAQPPPPMTAATSRAEEERMLRRLRSGPRVRAWALWALGRVGSPESLPLLEKGSLESDPGVRDAADEGLLALLASMAREGRLRSWAAAPRNAEAILRLLLRAIERPVPGGEAMVQALGGHAAAADLLQEMARILPPPRSLQASDLADQLRLAQVDAGGGPR